MSETTTPATELASQYIAQVTGDLDANVKEQERISAEIASLQEQLASLQRDHGVLVSTATPAESASDSATAVVPSPRRKKAGAAAGGKQKAQKSTAAPAKRAGRKSAAKTAGTAKAAEPTLVELIRRHLAEQKEPRSAAEISAALGQAHPQRDIAAKVVRVTLEGLVAKSQAERSKQGRSVFYSASAAQAAGGDQSEAQTEDTGGN
jgi:cell division septum initiation protein DivIVA